MKGGAEGAGLRPILSLVQETMILSVLCSSLGEKTREGGGGVKVRVRVIKEAG